MENTTNAGKKGFLQNDRLLVCSMLVFYGLCLIGLMVVTFRWLNDRKQMLSANTTATGVVIATQHANATATAVVRTTELAQYEFIDTFDSNINHWRMGPEESDYWNGSTQVTSGFYIWDIREVKKGFVSWADFPGNDYIKNYDTYVDIQFTEVPSGTSACSGLIFRKAPLGWDTGGYSFVICKAGNFNIHYHNIDGWQRINSQYHPSIRTSDWNRIEVLVNGTHFVFLINSQVVYETDDDRQPTGGVALVVDVDGTGTKILFDNFGYQSR
jgi:hypothetical protein